MSDIESWLDSIEAPRCDDRGWVYTNIGGIEAYIEEEKQALKQRLIDAVGRLDKEMPAWVDREPVNRFLEVIEKEFSEP